MNELDLPPRAPLPDDVRARLRHTVTTATPDEPSRSNHRAPLAVAAGVVVLAAGALLTGQLMTGPGGEGGRPGAVPPPPATRTADPTPAPVLLPPDARTDSDLDRCGAVVEASQGLGYPSRSSLVPAFSVTVDAGTRLVAAKERGGKPLYCHLAGTTVSVSDPSAEPMPLARDDSAARDVYGLLLTDGGLLAGVAQGVAALRFDVVPDDPAGEAVSRTTAPAVLNELFVANVGVLSHGDRVEVTAFDGAGAVILTGAFTYTADTARPPGVVGSG